MQKESRTVRPISLAFLGVQLTVGRQSTRATPWIAAATWAASSRTRVSRPYSTPALLASRPPLVVLRRPHINASAASESTTAGGLEALSELRWSREFENASSRFRRNQSSLLPLMLETGRAKETLEAARPTRKQCHPEALQQQESIRALFGNVPEDWLRRLHQLGRHEQHERRGDLRILQVLRHCHDTIHLPVVLVLDRSWARQVK